MSISNITREQFVHTITVPWAEPFEFLKLDKDFQDSWLVAGEGMRATANHLLTAGVRLATPAITGFGLGKHWVDHHPRLAVGVPLVAAGGAIVGAAVGIVGVAIDVAGAAFFTACSMGLVTHAGMESWRLPEPKKAL